MNPMLAFDVLPPQSRHVAMALLVLWAVLLYGGLLFGRYDPESLHRMPRWARLSSSLVLVILAWMLAAAWPREAQASFARWIALGMTFGFLGDLFMARLVVKSALYLPFGMGAFAVGHLFYLAAMLGWLRQANDAFWQARFPLILGLWLFLGIMGWYFVVYRGQEAEVLHFAALGYALLLCAVVAVAMRMSLQQFSFWGLFLGTLLFLISDLILSTRLFAGARWAYQGDVVWLFYGTGQMLIVVSSIAYR